ncbi:hypothetical protein W97_04583 [Coniosporium apollinis CBS 100218]|uniref:Peroxidase n=1 Tax=Coniosporium apollinis (strain CBS 100218) TaxID=1168221 RepID=R7YTX2_CONA1|nr:uncharacterized protein W97_04583 [Coniosporium apollinis CBS 100218]EON65345.1 hypothetical protein W97_04583 [Coniosporium apollinis CBS 100218]
MKPTNFLFNIALTAATLSSLVTAWPGLANLQKDLNKRLPQVAPADDGDGDGSATGAGELIGDLKNGITTPVGQTIANILTGKETGQSAATYRIPGLPGTKACKADPCCIWAHISFDLTLAFRGPSGRCNSLARQAIRLGFHDAAAWSKTRGGGGADGSIVLSGSEIKRPDNKGLEGIVAKAWALQKIFGPFGVGMADLIQFAANHAVVTCPLGPRTRTFIGRKDAPAGIAAPDGLMPDVNSDASTLIKLFEDKTITPHMLAALVGAHTTSQQFFVDPKKAGQPQDGTPGVWDTLFYSQTISGTPDKVFRLKSDMALANDSRVADEWNQFAGPGGQSHWNEDYASSYIRLSLLGVNNINSLTECTKVLPAARPTFSFAGQLYVDQ